MKQICEIPYSKRSAVENMAMDSVMLEFGSDMDQPMWRLYGWNEPAVTFGYSQKWDWIQAQLAGFEGVCIRRLTGGGIVDHRHDLTYSLTLQSNHPYYREPATQLYRDLHQIIATILLDSGFDVDLAPCLTSCGDDRKTGPSGICFNSPEPDDVILRISRQKVAGAAMKRNQLGILIQGSMELVRLPGLTIPAFNEEFGLALSHWLKLPATRMTGELPKDAMQRERERFSSIEWNRRR